VAAVGKHAIGGSNRLSMTAQQFTAELIQFIERNRPEGTPKPSKKSRNKKKNADAQPSSSESSPRSASDKDSSRESHPTRNEKRRGSSDAVTFKDTTRWTVDDMFAVNEAKFGIVNSFNMDEYSVPMPDAATQAKALEEYERNQAARGKGRDRSGTSPTLQPATKQSKNGRRHSIGAKAELAPAVANIFAMAAGNGTLPQAQASTRTTPLVTESESLEQDRLKLPSSQGHVLIPSSCAAVVTAPQKFSFQFNTEAILSCI
jgi:hypothetical protein